MKGTNQIDLELAKAAKQQKAVERSMEERDAERMLNDAASGGSKTSG